MTSALTSTPADSTVDRRQVSAGALQSQRPLCFSLCFSFLSSDGQTGADTGSDALRNLLRQSPGRRAGTVRNFSNDRWTFVFSLTRGLIFSFSSSKRQTLPISKVISKHKTLLPHPQGTAALRSALSSAPPGSRRTGGRCDWVRALQRCMRGTNAPGFNRYHKTECMCPIQNAPIMRHTSQAITLGSRGADNILGDPISDPTEMSICPTPLLLWEKFNK